MCLRLSGWTGYASKERKWWEVCAVVIEWSSNLPLTLWLMEGCRTTREEGLINMELITGTKCGLAKRTFPRGWKWGWVMNWICPIWPVLLWTELQLVRLEGDAWLGADVHNYKGRGAWGQMWTRDRHKAVLGIPILPSVTTLSSIKPDQSRLLRLGLCIYLQYLQIEINKSF